MPGPSFATAAFEGAAGGRQVAAQALRETGAAQGSSSLSAAALPKPRLPMRLLLGLAAPRSAS